MAEKAKRVKILIYPKLFINTIKHGVQNPYQDLIYKKIINNKNYEIKFISRLVFGRPSIGALIFPIKLIFYRLKGFNILHIQFLYPFFPILKAKFIKIIFYYNLICNLKIIKILGFKLIWTLHEVIPHSPQFLNDIAIRKLIANQSAAIIVHSKNTIREMDKLGYNTNNVYITAHGNFIGVYPNKVTKVEAKKYFKLSNNDFVFLLFGILSPYKGVYKLIDSANQILIDKNNSKIKFIIAGKTIDKDVISRLQALKNKYPNNIILNIGYIDNENIQYYYNAADIVTCPFTHINTSSTAILALSFKKPLIYSKIGDFIDLPNNIGISYDPENINGLTESINKAINNKMIVTKMSTAAYAYAKQLSWERIANDTLNIYKEVFNK